MKLLENILIELNEVLKTKDFLLQIKDEEIKRLKEQLRELQGDK